MLQEGTYLELDKDEMEYVDGGGHYIVEKGLFCITHNVGFCCAPLGLIATAIGIGVALLSRTFSVGASTGKGVLIRKTNGFGFYVG